MAWITRYEVRVIEDGKLVTKRRFALKDKALNFAADKLIRRRRVKIARESIFKLETFQNTVWGPAPHDAWAEHPGNLKMVFIHHSVTQQLPASATIEQEKAHMRLLDQIAHGRGFNGISYSWVVFPSGRCWEGRGWRKIEAATEGFNTSSDSIVLAGNYSSFAMTDLHKEAIWRLIRRAQNAGVFVKGGLNVRAHREVSATSCPGTKVTAEHIQAIERKVNS